MEADNIHVVAVDSDTVDPVVVAAVGLAASMMAFAVNKSMLNLPFSVKFSSSTYLLWSRLR